MKAVLVICPGWTLSCPTIGLPLLKAYLEEKGHDVLVVDIAALIHQGLTPEDRRAVTVSDPKLFNDEREIESFLDRNAALVDPVIAKVLEFGGDVVGFSIYQITRRFSEVLAARIKRSHPSRLIVFGGPEGRKIVDEQSAGGAIAPGIDAVIPGEGEIALANLLANVKDGRFRPSVGALVKTTDGWVWAGDADAVADLDALPSPDFSDYDLGKYENAPILATYFSRGCVRKCTFCDVEYYWGKWRNRSGRRVFEELKHLFALYPDTSSVMFCDSILNADMRALEEFCDLVIEANKRGEMRPFSWYGFTIVRQEMTRAVLDKMAASGCFQLWFGIESGSQKVVNLMKKGFRVEVADRVLKESAAAGIQNSVLLMIGFPGETRDDFQDTVEFVRRNAPYINDLSPSESFTYIGQGTPLRANAFGAYGVDPEGFHEIFWRSKDGENNYLERAGRFEALCKAALECGVPIGYTMEKIVRAKETALKNFASWSSGRDQ